MNEFNELDIGTNAASPVAFSEEIVKLIRSDLTPKKKREKIEDYHEKDIALALEALTSDEQAKLFRLLPMESLVSILEYCENIAEYFAPLSMRQKVEALSMMEASTAVDLLQSLSKLDREQLTDLLTPELRSEIRLLSSFDEDEIGSKMTTNYIAIPEGLGVRQAMHELIEQAAENDNVSTIYVIDEDETLLGAIDLKDLIRAREGSSLDDIIMTSYPYVYATDLIDECIERIKEYGEDSIPVLDSENKLKINCFTI